MQNKSKDHERNSTRPPRVSGVQSGVTKSRGACVTVPIYELKGHYRVY